LFRGGFRDGDVIISVNRRPVRSEDEFYEYVHTHRGQRAPIVVLRDGREETLYLNEEQSLLPADQQVRQAPPDAAARPYFGVVFDPRIRDAAVIQSVHANSPAEAAGLKAGDELVAINGERLYSYRDAIDMIRSTRPGVTIDIDFSRRLDSQTQAVIDSAPGGPLRTATNPADARVQTDVGQAPDQSDRSSELRRGEVDRDEEYRDRPRESDDDQRLFNRGLLRGRRN
jgi:S1-C subfamily serine protease